MHGSSFKFCNSPRPTVYQSLFNAHPPICIQPLDVSFVSVFSMSPCLPVSVISLRHWFVAQSVCLSAYPSFMSL